MIQRFTKGPRALKDRLNELVDAVNRMDRSRGGIYIDRVTGSAGGTTDVMLNPVRRRIPKFERSGTGVNGVIPYARWPLTTTEGGAEIIKSLDGTLQGTANTTYDGLQLDGDSDYLDLDARVSSFLGLSRGSISLWVYNGAGLNKALFAFTNGAGSLSDGAFHLRIIGATVLDMYCPPTMRFTYTIGTGWQHQWTHLVYTSGTSGNAFYINGVKISPTYADGSASTECFFSHADAIETPTSFLLGAQKTSGSVSAWWRGQISDFRVYNTVLTDNQIKELYASTNKNYVHADEVSGACKVFKVASNATGDGVYNCYEQTLDATEWDDTAGDAKFDNKNTTNIEVLNMGEAHPPDDDYVRQLTAGDFLIGFRKWDDEYGFRWVGMPYRVDDGNTCRVAYVTSAPGAVATISAELDYKDSGKAITAYAQIAQGGTALNAAIPRLAADDAIMVTKCRYYDGTSVRDRWVCTTVFQPSEDCVCDDGA